MRLVVERIDPETGFIVKIYKSLSPNQKVGFRSKLIKKYELVDEAGNRWVVGQNVGMARRQVVTVSPTWPEPPNPHRRKRRERSDPPPKEREQ